MSTIAFDYGKRFLGVAVTDETGSYVKELPCIRVGYTNKYKQSGLSNKVIKLQQKKVFEIIAKLVSYHYCTKIVVGLPIGTNISSKGNNQVRKIKKFFQSLDSFLRNKGILLSIEFIDETFSSIEAYDSLKAEGLGPQKISEKIHSRSARIILENYIAHKQKTV